MTSIAKDPLLAIAKGLLWFLMGVMGLAAVACLVAIPAVLIMQDTIAAQIASELHGASFHDFLGALCLVLVLAAGLLGLLFRIFQLLKRIVDTVGQGDPFVPVNARRLTQMAWITLAIQLISLPLAGVAMWIHEVTEGATRTGFRSELGLDANGLLLMLILFILARVFRKGAEMRDELEGTV